MISFKRRALKLVATGVAAMVAISACGDDSGQATGATSGDGSVAESQEPTRGGSAEFLIHADVASLDPAKTNTTAAAGGSHLYAVYGALVVQTPDESDVVPVLAESLEPNDGFDVWTLRLREGLEFSDGSPFDAETVKLNWDRVKDPATGSPGISAAAEVSSMDAVDATTLEITLAAPNALFDRMVGRSNLNYIAAPAALAPAHDIANEPIGAGPFLLESWIRDDRKVFVRNPKWYDAPRPYLDQLTLRVVTDEQQRLDTMLTGGANGLYTHASNTIAAGTEAGASFAGVSVGSGSVINMNVTAAPFDDPRMRQVIAMGIDLEALLEAIEGASGVAPTNMAPDDAPWNSAESALPEFDPAAAQELLDEYLNDTGQESISVRMITVTVPRTTAIAKFVQTALAQLDGIEVVVEPIDQSSLIERAFSRNYELANWGYPTVNPDPDMQTAVHSKSRANTTGYSNPKVDGLFDEARRTGSAESRVGLYTDVFKVLAEDLPFLPINHARAGWVHDNNTRLAGVHLDGILRSDQVWLDR